MKKIQQLKHDQLSKKQKRLSSNKKRVHALHEQLSAVLSNKIEALKDEDINALKPAQDIEKLLQSYLKLNMTLKELNSEDDTSSPAFDLESARNEILSRLDKITTTK